MKSIDKSLRWFVARSKPSQWAKAAKELREADFTVYCPMKRVEKPNKRTNTFRTTESPVLVGYMFVGMRADAMHFGRIRDDCSAVGGLLGINGEPGMVPATEVEKIWLAEIDMAFDDTKAARVHRGEELPDGMTRKLIVEQTRAELVGKSVSPKDGPWAGLPGIVDSVTSTGSVAVLMALFGRMTVVEFEPSQLSPAKAA